MSSSSCTVCVCVCVCVRVLCFIEFPVFAYVCDAGRGCSLTFVHAATCRFCVPSADLTARRPVSQRQKWLLQRQSCTYCFEAAIFLLLPVITGVAATLTYTDTFLVLCSSSPPPVVCLSRQCFLKQKGVVK